jgi:hypothetical protein
METEERSMSVNNHQALDKTVLPLTARLRDLTIDNAGRFVGSAKVTGRVTCQTLGRVPARLALRLSNQTRPNFSYIDTLPSPEGELRFSFPPLHDPKDEKKEFGARAVFLDLCTVAQAGGPFSMSLHSNTLGMLVDVVDPFRRNALNSGSSGSAPSRSAKLATRSRNGWTLPGAFEPAFIVATK